MDLVAYSFVLLRRGPRAHEYEGEALDRLQAAHLAHLDAMRERGALLVAGPFGKQEDETLRGFAIYPPASRRRARSLPQTPRCRPGGCGWT